MKPCREDAHGPASAGIEQREGSRRGRLSPWVARGGVGPRPRPDGAMPIPARVPRLRRASRFICLRLYRVRNFPRGDFFLHTPRHVPGPQHLSNATACLYTAPRSLRKFHNANGVRCMMHVRRRVIGCPRPR